MDCDSVLKEVGNYIDGEVSLSCKAEIELHLGCCRNCRAVYNTVEKTIRIYCDKPVEVPDEVRQKVREALQTLARDGAAEKIVTNGGPNKWFGMAKRKLRGVTEK